MAEAETPEEVESAFSRAEEAIRQLEEDMAGEKNVIYVTKKLLKMCFKVPRKC